MAAKSDFPDYYDVLHVRSDATAEQIKAAFHREINYWHPDRWMDAPEGAREFARIKTTQVLEANEFLGNTEARSRYDEFYVEWRELKKNPLGDEATKGTNKEGDNGSGKKSLEERLQKAELEVIDKRLQGGTLWVVGGPEHRGFFEELRSEGHSFVFMSRGGRAVKHRSAWYLKN